MTNKRKPSFADKQPEDSKAPPERIGPYLIEGLHRSGGMSLVYTALDPATQDLIAIKVLKAKYKNSPDIIAQFNHEAKILAMANHPNIVALYAHKSWEGGPYIAMEFIQGESLHRILSYNPLPLRRSVAIILEIAYALCHLHTLGVTHRDLKPENILLTKENEVKLIDLGVAHNLPEVLTENSKEQKKQTKHFIGTPVYMSPEQRFAADTVSFPSDIYSLGIIAYELVLGKLSHGQIHLALIPKGLQPILSKALQPQIKDRYQDVVAFISALSVYLKSDQLEKDAKGTDQLSELTDHLQQAQEILSPSHPPKWPHVDVGIACQQGIGMYGLYYDFFSFASGDYAVLLAEPKSKGITGIAYTSALRGMAHTLSHLTYNPNKLVAFLNHLVFHNAPHQVFLFSYLMVAPKQKRITYISCEKTAFWLVQAKSDKVIQIGAQNQSLGLTSSVECKETVLPWQENDCIILATEPLSEAISAFIKQPQAVPTLLAHTPQKQAELLLRRATVAGVSELESWPRAVLTLVLK